ncbi:MAG: hypothetical protein ACYC6R_05560 [Anaerolineales bacterium]
MKNFDRRDFIWILPFSISLGTVLSFLQPGNWIIGWLGFSFLFLLCVSLLTLLARWAGGGKTLAWMIALAFVLRFSGGVATYLALPVYGYVDEDQSAGFVYTDAHRRDSQAWELAGSDRPIMDAFNEKFAYDQYGGLLAFSALIYRYLSPDAHRVLMLVLLSAFMGALGVPFLWKAVAQEWGTKVAFASGWVFALYPESILLGGSAMREPYLMAFSAIALWGFINSGVRQQAVGMDGSKLLHSRVWLGLGIAGMLLVSPSVALVTLIIFGGWIYFTSEHRRISWWAVSLAVIVFIAGLFLLSSALDRQGNLGGGSPIGVINNFMREAVKWDVYQLERGSGWVQKLFDEMPEWLRLPFVTIYGVLQPVLPAIFIAPTTSVWRIIGILRAVGWYALLPALILSFAASAGAGTEKKRKLFIWLSLVVWAWILFTALRGGGDQWDNPRYRAILFLWQALLAGNVWVWWRETKNAWFPRVIAMEIVFVVVFGQWYANRYLHIGMQLPFAYMLAIIFGLWAGIFVWGIWRDKKQHT